MTQAQRVLQHLKMGNTLTRLQGWDELGVLETPARITELRGQGHDIKTKRITVKNRFGEKVSIAEWSMQA